MHNPKSLLENEMHKPRRDFKIQTERRISAKWPNLVRVNKKKKKRERESAE